MPIYDLYSKRQKRLHGDVPDVYTYDNFPEGLRNQIVHIWRDTIGDGPNDVLFYEQLSGIIAREYGLAAFPSRKMGARSNPIDEFFTAFITGDDFDLVLDITELSFKGVGNLVGKSNGLTEEHYDDAIDELNKRFQQHGVGYQFIDKEMVRIDSQLIHAEAVKPALHLLNRSEFAGPQEEFLKSHEHYRKGDYKEAMTECAKSLESLLKAICVKRAWHYDANATAKQLITICFEKGLIPAFWQGHFSSLRSMLESSVPTGRNKLAAHGQGTTSIKVPDCLVAYMLHMTASTIVFLAEAEAAL